MCVNVDEGVEIAISKVGRLGLPTCMVYTSRFEDRVAVDLIERDIPGERQVEDVRRAKRYLEKTLRDGEPAHDGHRPPPTGLVPAER
jgi:hypothetical protein